MYRLEGVRGVLAAVFENRRLPAWMGVQEGGQIVDCASDDDPAAAFGFVFGYLGSIARESCLYGFLPLSFFSCFMLGYIHKRLTW